MKWVLWILLLGNVCAFAYIRLVGDVHQSHEIGHENIAADQVKILSATDLEAIPNKSDANSSGTATAATATTSTVAANEPLACFEWGSFSALAVTKARAILDKLSLPHTVEAQTTQESTRYWVYIPPLKSPELAQKKVSELAALGITDIYVVQEAPWRYAVSLGLFKDANLANNFLQDMKARGVRSAVKGTRNYEAGQSRLLIKNVSPSNVTEINQHLPEFTGSEFKQTTCQ